MIQILGQFYVFVVAMMLFVGGILAIGLAQINMTLGEKRMWVKIAGLAAMALGASILKQMYDNGWFNN